MKKVGIIALIVFGGLLLIGLIVVGKGIGIRNQIVTLEETVKAGWGQVQNTYQRRADLIPNLVETVKGYAGHENETLRQVTEARAKLGGTINLPAEAVNNPAMMQKFAAAQSSLSGALQRLMVVSEKYPDLKANQNFLDLQVQLEGTENRIAVERRNYNEKVQEFNIYIRKFPNNLVAGFMGAQRAQLFEADVGAQKAPQVKF